MHKDFPHLRYLCVCFLTCGSTHRNMMLFLTSFSVKLLNYLFFFSVDLNTLVPRTVLEAVSGVCVVEPPSHWKAGSAGQIYFQACFYFYNTKKSQVTERLIYGEDYSHVILLWKPDCSVKSPLGNAEVA